MRKGTMRMLVKGHVLYSEKSSFVNCTHVRKVFEHISQKTLDAPPKIFIALMNGQVEEHTYERSNQ